MSLLSFTSSHLRRFASHYRLIWELQVVDGDTAFAMKRHSYWTTGLIGMR